MRSHPSESWPGVNREHLPVVEAELNIGHVIENIAKHDLEQGTSDGLEKFVNWTIESLNNGAPVINEKDIITLDGGDVEHTVTHIRGYAYDRRDRKESSEKVKVVPIDARTNLEQSLQRLFSYVRQFSPNGMSEATIKAKFSDRLEKAFDDFTAPKVKRLI